MFNRKEIFAITSVSIVLSLLISLLLDVKTFLRTLLFVFVIIMINVLMKKATSYFFELETEIKLWKFRRWGCAPHQSLKRDFPAGLFFPILSKIILFPLVNGFIWMAALVFDIKTKVYRSAKRHGLYSFSEISEDHIAYIAIAGIVANLFFAIIAYFLGFSKFAELSIWFIFFNMIPISNLDGNKIFFGNRVLWSLLSVITLILLGYTFLVV